MSSVTPEVTDPTTVLYTLTTLAQSCAALAAFVGAVGVFRLQMLREQRRDPERELRASAAKLTTRDMIENPLPDVVSMIDQEPGTDRLVAAAMEARDRWAAFVPRSQKTRIALLVLEAWNLGVIGVSLIGFNYVPILARAPWFSSILVAVATGTVLVPLWCVWVWTRGVEH